MARYVVIKSFIVKNVKVCSHQIIYVSVLDNNIVILLKLFHEGMLKQWNVSLIQNMGTLSSVNVNMTGIVSVFLKLQY